MMIQVQPNQAVIITKTFIVDFMTRHADDDVILRACEDAMLTYCKMVDDFIANHAQQHQKFTDTNKVLSFLQAMESRNKDCMASIEQKLGLVSESVDRGLNSASTAIADKVTGQIAGLLTAVNNAVSRLDTNTITADIVQSVNKVAHQHADASQDERVQILDNMKESVAEALVQPVKSCHQEVLDVIGTIPDKLADKIQTSELQSTLCQPDSDASLGV
jgi:hypothetical protein